MTTLVSYFITSVLWLVSDILGPVAGKKLFYKALVAVQKVLYSTHAMIRMKRQMTGRVIFDLLGL